MGFVPFSQLHLVSFLQLHPVTMQAQLNNFLVKLFSVR